MSFRRRGYPEIMESVLTGLTGGVAAESHAYPPQGAAPFEHALENPPVEQIISVHGMRNNQSFQFTKETDYALKNNKLIWLEAANTPDPGSVFHINYSTQGATSTFNDLQVGSVLRTLSESFSLEMAGLYAQAEAVYKAGFVDTAENRSLENVVALLGVQRIKAGRNVALVKFDRNAAAVGDIHIPAGTRIASADASIQYETVVSVTLLNSQNSVQVSARDVDDNIEGLAASSLVLLTKPLAGIESVTNPAATEIAEQDETDEMLRTRSKNFLHGSEKATLGAIRQAIAQQNVVADVIENDPLPGHIAITVYADSFTPEVEQRLNQAIRDVRPAGINVYFKTAAAPLAVDMDLRISTVDDLLEADLRFIQEQAVSQIKDYINSLAVAETVSVNRIIGLVLSNSSIVDVKILSAMVAATDVLAVEKGIIDISQIPVPANNGIPLVAGAINIIDPALASTISLMVDYPINKSPPSAQQITSALQKAIEFINSTNAQELADDASPEQLRQRQINYGKLLSWTPLPIKPALIDYAAVSASEDANLPTSAVAGEYNLQYLITSASGISHILSSETSPAITLTAFERLSLAAVELKAKAEALA
ncbi:MAG: baseplate J/gp47 family protein [Pseudomonadales bacterium]|nr:baseplate J/gp47 family protein [Pseudomonadales bacterium]